MYLLRALCILCIQLNLGYVLSSRTRIQFEAECHHVVAVTFPLHENTNRMSKIIPHERKQLLEAWQKLESTNASTLNPTNNIPEKSYILRCVEGLCDGVFEDDYFRAMKQVLEERGLTFRERFRKLSATFYYIGKGLGLVEAKKRSRRVLESARIETVHDTKWFLERIPGAHHHLFPEANNGKLLDALLKTQARKASMPKQDPLSYDCERVA